MNNDIKILKLANELKDKLIQQGIDGGSITNPTFDINENSITFKVYINENVYILSELIISSESQEQIMSLKVLEDNQKDGTFMYTSLYDNRVDYANLDNLDLILNYIIKYKRIFEKINEPIEVGEVEPYSSNLKNIENNLNRDYYSRETVDNLLLKLFSPIKPRYSDDNKCLKFYNFEELCELIKEKTNLDIIQTNNDSLTQKIDIDNLDKKYSLLTGKINSSIPSGYIIISDDLTQVFLLNILNGLLIELK